MKGLEPVSKHRGSVRCSGALWISWICKHIKKFSASVTRVQWVVSLLLLWNLQSETSPRDKKEDRFCASDLVDHSDDLVVALKWLWSSLCCWQQVLGGKKTYWCHRSLLKEHVMSGMGLTFSCQHYQHRMKHSWTVQALLVDPVRFTSILQCSVHGGDVWVAQH